MASRRGHGEGAIYQDPSGRWRASIELGRDHGRRKRKYLSGKTRQEVAKKLRTAQQSVDVGLDLPTGHSPTFGAWLTTYLDTIAARKVRSSTLVTYQSLADKRIIPTVGHIRLDKLRPEHLERMYTALEAELKPASVLQIHRIISRSLKVAMQRNLVARNVATLVDAPSVERQEIKPPTKTEVLAVLAKAADVRNTARWSAALALGLRQGEALGLRWHDVDLDTGVVAVRQALQRTRAKHGCGGAECGKSPGRCPQKVGGGLTFVPPKSRAGKRVIALPPALHEALRSHRMTQLQERLFAGTDWQDFDLVFCQPNGRPLDPRSDHREWQRLLTAAGVGKYRLHDARHFAATLLLSQGVPPRVVMEILGHSQVTLTLGTYSHVDGELTRAAAERIDAALWGPPDTMPASL